MIEPPEVPHQHAHHEGAPRRGLAKWFFEAVMPVSVLLMSLGSLYVALHTGSAMDKLVAHNEKLVKAQSTPILEYGTSNYVIETKKHSLSFKIANVGTGPAQLRWLRVRDGDKVYAHFGPWLMSLADEADHALMRQSDVITGTLDDSVLPARDERLALVWDKPEASQAALLAVWEKANVARGSLAVEFCYCSVFDDCWLKGRSAAKPLPRCEAPLEPSRPASAARP